MFLLFTIINLYNGAQIPIGGPVPTNYPIPTNNIISPIYTRGGLPTNEPITTTTPTTNVKYCPEGTILECVKHQEKRSTLYPKWKEIENENYYFYNPDTFGINIAKDPCATVTRSKLINALNNKCVGKWCKNGKFECGGTGRECYEMEHIVDKNCKGSNVWANVVMAYGKWNIVVSNKPMGGCLNAFHEKTEIYGKVMTDKVKKQLDLCSKKAHKRNNENDTNGLVILDDSYNEPIDGFDYSECDISCTCESNKYLDILCECDYSETDFDPSLCSKNQPVLGSKIIESILFIITGLVIGIVCTLLGFVSSCVYARYFVKKKHELVIDDEYM
jgi:hypothetical protein